VRWVAIAVVGAIALSGVGATSAVAASAKHSPTKHHDYGIPEPVVTSIVPSTATSAGSISGTLANANAGYTVNVTQNGSWATEQSTSGSTGTWSFTFDSLPPGSTYTLWTDIHGLYSKEITGTAPVLDTSKSRIAAFSEPSTGWGSPADANVSLYTADLGSLAVLSEPRRASANGDIAPGLWNTSSLSAPGGAQAPLVVVNTTRSTTPVRDRIYLSGSGVLMRSMLISGTWSAAVAIPTAAPPVGELSAVTDLSGRVGVAQLFWRDASGNLQHDYLNRSGVWIGGPALASGLTTDPVAITTGPGTDVFYTKSDGLLHHVWYLADKGWWADSVLPSFGVVAGPVTAISSLVDQGVRENVFWRDTYGQIQQSYLNVVGTSAQWIRTTLVGGVAGDPVAVKNNLGMDLFYTGTGGELRTMSYRGKWSGSTAISGAPTMTGQLSAVVDADGIDESVFGHGTDKQVKGVRVNVPHS
jgi:hypothetical protein